MTKKPKSKAANWAAYTKSELVQACNTLSAQKTKLLNKIAKLDLEGTLRESAIEHAEIEIVHPSEQKPFKVITRMPWET
jgi:hypothetical protein